MADTRHLKRRRQGWYFILAVPRDVQAKFGAKRVELSLKTRDLTVAQRSRWARAAEYNERFGRLRGALTREVIETLAAETYTRTLARLEANAKRGKRLRAAPMHEDDDRDPEVIALDLEADRYAEAIQEQDFAPVADEIEDIAKRFDIPLPVGSETYNLLGQAILEAIHSALRGRIAALGGQPSEAPASFLSPIIDPVTLQAKAQQLSRPKIKTDAQGVRFNQASEQFLAELQRDPDAALTEQTRLQMESVHRLFGQFTNNAPLAGIDRATASKFLDAISRLHPHWGRSPKTKSLTVWEVLERFGHGDEKISNTTLNRAVTSLSQVFKWARKRGYFEGSNPFSEQSRPKPRKGSREWLPYTDAELTMLFGSPLFHMPAKHRIQPERHTFETALMWVPLIALFSGMRLGEVCQLRTHDLQREGSVHFFNITEEADGQRVKTASGVRHVPVHSELIRCGLLTYHQHVPTGQLFPGLREGGPDKKLSWYFTRRWTEYRRSVGVDRRRVSFHSFRKNVGTALDRARVPQSDIAELIGHERGFTLDTYAPLGLELPTLETIVEKVRYPGLKLVHLYT